MGIKGLWTVLTPYGVKKSLHEIRGETVAVDLSGWICDSQNVTDYHIQPKLYLRNLFFRTIYLLLADIEPIFVLEGDAPELKQDVMAARNAIQFKGAAPKSDKSRAKRPDVARRRFRGILKECELLLRSLGARCVKGDGEAEATCAQLNAQGLVDAVVSQDSDSFAYGARKVYKNFSVSNSAGGGALQGSVDCFDAEEMFKSNGFGRNKMVALAVLCGCDYGAGACGSMVTTAVSFLHSVPEREVIHRLLSWVSEPEKYECQSRWLAAPGRCERCGHGGKQHARQGCPACGTHKACLDTGHKAKMAEVKKEVSLRSRALSSGLVFPAPRVTQEFLRDAPAALDVASLRKPTPSLVQFVKLMSNKLDWSERYCVEKFLPLLTKYHLQEKVPCRTIQPVAIKKKRNPRGVPSYEVVWTDINGQYDALIPDDQFEDEEDRSVVWTSIERQDLIRQYYSELVDAYEESIKKPPKEKKTRGRKKKDNDNDKEIKPKRKYNKKVQEIIEDDIANLSDSVKQLDLNSKTEHNSSKLNVSVNVNKLKRKLKNNPKNKQKTIDSFVKSKKSKTDQKLIKSLRLSFKNMSLFNDEIFDNDSPCFNVEENNDQCLNLDENNDQCLINGNNDQRFNSEENNKRCLNFDRNNDQRFNLKENNDLCYNLDENYDPCFNLEDINVPYCNYQENNKEHRNMIINLDSTSMSEDNVSDLSEIIDNIIKKAPSNKTAKIDNNLVRLVFDKCFTPRKSVIRKSILTEIGNNCSTPKDSPLKYNFNRISSISNRESLCKINKSITPKDKCKKRKSTRISNISKNNSVCQVNISYFFDKLTDDCDAFEMSIGYKNSIVDLELEATVEYSLPPDYSLPDVQL